MRLIDADALKEKAHKEFQYLEITLKDIDGLIKSAPTIEPPKAKAMSARDISNLMWAISVLEEIPTETIEQDRAVSIGISAIQDKAGE